MLRLLLRGGDRRASQSGNRLFGTVEQDFSTDGKSSTLKYALEATVEDGEATGRLEVGNQEVPMKIFRQGDGIRLEVMTWSWKPLLIRKDP